MAKVLEFKPGERPPESAQRAFDFDGPGCGATVTELPRPVAAARDWFEEACALEAVSPQESIEAYRRALELQPDHREAHVNRGRLLHELGDLESAEQHYRTAAEMAPDDAICAYNLGVVLQDQGREREALGAYEKALALDPQLRDAHFNVAQLYEQQGQRVSALRHLSVYRRLSR